MNIAYTDGRPYYPSGTTAYAWIHQPVFRDFSLSAWKKYEIEIIDTWEMTINKLEGVYSGDFKIDLPGKPYICVKINCVGETEAPVSHTKRNAAYSIDSTIGELLDNEKVCAVLDQYIPQMTDNPMIGAIKGMKLQDILKFSAEQFPPEKLKELDAALRGVSE
jgi:hypothetical protein